MNGLEVGSRAVLVCIPAELLRGRDAPLGTVVARRTQPGAVRLVLHCEMRGGRKEATNENTKKEHITCVVTIQQNKEDFCNNQFTVLNTK